MNAQEISRWGWTGLFGLFWLLCSVGNIGSIINAVRRKGSTSLILFFGGVSGVIAMLVCPIPGLWVWCWVPALLDIGTLPALATMLFRSAFSKRADEEKTKDRKAP